MLGQTSSNPALRGDTFRGFVAPGQETMTVNGVVTKSLVLLVLLATTFMWTWNAYTSGDNGLAIGVGSIAGIVGMIVSIVCSFKPQWSPVLAPVFALLEGAALGLFSAAMENGAATRGYAGYDGVVAQAMMGTMLVFVSMLVAYRTGIIKVTDRFRTIVTTAMMAIFLTYLATFLLGLVGVNIPAIHESGTIGIAFSLIVIGVAALMLAVDFDMIERGAQQGAPKYMEWYGSFALLVTVIWIYIEMLRLLSKLRSR